ncbi:MAG: 50S ribosomal protein L32 [Elusimicrobiota bacterium]
MAVPKRKLSRTRTRRRRSSKKAAMPQTSMCPKCSQAKLPHRVCPNCGYYGDKKIIDREQEE